MRPEDMPCAYVVAPLGGMWVLRKATEGKGDIFDLLRVLAEVQGQGLNLKALGTSRKVLTGLVKAELERDKNQLKQIRQTYARRPEPADPLKGFINHRKARPDADTDL